MKRDQFIHEYFCAGMTPPTLFILLKAGGVGRTMNLQMTRAVPLRASFFLANPREVWLVGLFLK